MLPPTRRWPGEIRSCASHASSSLAPRRLPEPLRPPSGRYTPPTSDACVPAVHGGMLRAFSLRPRPEVPPVRPGLSRSRPSTSAPRTSARSKSITTTTPSPRPSTAARSSCARSTCGATRNSCRSTASRPSAGRSAARRWSGPTASPTSWASSKLWIKNDAVNFPTLSFKDRVVAVALSKAREFGFTTVGCASTGNLANSVAANAAAAGLESYIFVPADLERAKILGTSVYGAKVIGVQRHLRRGQPPLHAGGRSSTAGASSTSTCGRSTPRAPRRSASRSPSSSAGGRRSTSSARWPAAA